VTYQGTHFINDAIRYLIDHLILKHISFIVYYPQGNGQVQSINKVLGTLFTKLVNENRNDWYEHMSTLLFFHLTTLKVGIGHIPFQLAYYIHCYLRSTCYHPN
jgi:hypothetical protein